MTTTDAASQPVVAPAKVPPEKPQKDEGDDSYEAKIAAAEEKKNEGNVFLAAGDFDSACERYGEGLQIIQRLPRAGPWSKKETSEEGEDKPDDKARDMLGIPFHLNLALANMKRDELGKARLHCHSALAIDGGNVKGLYRRAMIQIRLAKASALYDDCEAQAAESDLKKALEIDPKNEDCKRELKRLHADMEASKKDTQKKSKTTWAHIYSKDKDNATFIPQAPVEVGPPVRPCMNTDRRLVMSVQDVSVRYEKQSSLALDSASFDLRDFWCFGVCGARGSGKTALARAVDGRQRIASGRISRHGAHQPALISAYHIFGALVPCMALVIGAWRVSTASIMPVVLALIVAVPVIFVIGFLFFLDQRHKYRKRCTWTFLSSQESDWESLSSRATVGSLIGEQLPKTLGKMEKVARTSAILRAARFPEEVASKPDSDHGALTLRYGALPADQRQLVHVLRAIAKASDVLVCDEILEGIDEVHQPRVLRMLQQLKRDLGTSIVYITSDSHQLSFMADSAAFLKDGKIVEKGPAQEVLIADKARHEATKEFLTKTIGNKILAEIGQALDDGYTALLGDADLKADWLPRAAKKRPEAQ